MRKKWTQIAVLAAALLIAAVTLANGLFDKKTGGIPKEGQAAPDFKLADLQSEVHRLSDYRGQTVVVNFWGTFCPPCREEMPDLEKQYREWKDQGVHVLGVNLNGDSEVAVKSFIGELGVTFPILPDKTDEVRKRYRVTNFPTSFFIDPKGIIRHIKVGQMDEAFIRSALSDIVSKKS